MSAPRKLRRFWRPDVRADVDEELAFHVDMRAAEYVAAGMTPDAARRRALARFGEADPVRAECVAIGDRRQRAMHRAEFRSSLGHDIAFALRTLRRQRLPALVAVVCLALGIGATTTVFGVANTLLMRPLPFPNGDRLVRFVTVRQGRRLPSGVSSLEDIADWRARQRAVAPLGAYTQGDLTFLRDDQPGGVAERVRGTRVSAEFFAALGVAPERGRLFVARDDAPGAARVAVVSRGFADRMLGGAARAVGAVVRLGGEPVTVVGVLPERWRYPETSEVWVPLALGGGPERRGNRFLETVGVLRPGVTLDQARRDVAALTAALAREHPVDNAETTAEVEPLRERYVRRARPAFMAMVVAAGLVFLTACANVASLQLARAAARAGEIAVRAALGAARRRLVTQLLTESVLLALAGGALGIALAVAGSGAVARAVPIDLPPWMTFGVDWRVLAFTLAVSAGAGVLFGLAPALRLSRDDAPRALRASGRGGGLDLTRGRFYRALVAAEVGLSVVLLVGAALAVESFARLRRVDPGFDPRGVVAFRLSAQGARYESDTARAALVRAVVERAAALPGVRAAGATTHLPIRDCCSRFGFEVEGRAQDPARRPMATGAQVTPGYFHALGIPLLRGREFTDADRAGAPPVAVVSETFARQYWPGEDPLGKRFLLGDDRWTVVGVVRDVKQAALADAPEPQFYRPHAQDPWETVTVAVRAATPAGAAALVPALRRAVLAVDPTLPPFGFAPMAETLAGALAAERLYGALFAAYAVVALALATAGVYGVAAYYVSRRTHEIGVRMALGAGRAQVHRTVLRQGAAVAAGGLALGLVGAAAGARVLARVLYGVQAGAPGPYLAAAAAIGVTVCLATLGPARRASRLAPSAALRAD